MWSGSTTVGGGDSFHEFEEEEEEEVGVMDDGFSTLSVDKLG